MADTNAQGGFRRWVSLAFGLVSLAALAVFDQAVQAFATKKGWDQFFISGWRMLTSLGLADVVAFSFFALGGATLALWAEFWIRGRREAKAKKERIALSCTAKFSFSKDSAGRLGVDLADQSENVAYYAWYVNNGGTMRNEAVLLYVEFEKEIPAPEVFAHSSASDGQWRQFAVTDRFAFVELKGWPDDEVVVQAIDSAALGLDRRAELMIWRPYAPIG